MCYRIGAMKQLVNTLHTHHHIHILHTTHTHTTHTHHHTHILHTHHHHTLHNVYQNFVERNFNILQMCNVIYLLQAFNVLKAHIDMQSQQGRRRLDSRVLDVRHVDVSLDVS